MPQEPQQHQASPRPFEEILDLHRILLRRQDRRARHPNHQQTKILSWTERTKMCFMNPPTNIRLPSRAPPKTTKFRNLKILRRLTAKDPRNSTSQRLLRQQNLRSR